jgi:hypothetical protein
MIRERVSTRGLIRPLEPESDLPAMQVPSDLIGTIPERAIQRYVTAKERSDKKFAHTIRRIEKKRLRNIDRAWRDMNQHIAALQHYLDRESQAAVADSTLHGSGADRTERTTSCWNMAWALDEDERPPPSSIVARRDTEEALKLARIADKAVLASERTLSANNLWNVIVSTLMATPEERRRNHKPSLPCRSPKIKAKGTGTATGKGTAHVVGARKTSLRSFLGRRRRSDVVV